MTRKSTLSIKGTRKDEDQYYFDHSLILKTTIFRYFNLFYTLCSQKSTNCYSHVRTRGTFFPVLSPLGVLTGHRTVLGRVSSRVSSGPSCSGRTIQLFTSSTSPRPPLVSDFRVSSSKSLGVPPDDRRNLWVEMDDSVLRFCRLFLVDGPSPRLIFKVLTVPRPSVTPGCLVIPLWSNLCGSWGQL